MASQRSLIFLLIHGEHAGSWVWKDVASRLVLPTIAPDLPGHGSDRAPLRGLSYSSCVAALARAVPPDASVIVVGHSLGSAIGLAFCQAMPVNVVHFVTVAGPIPRPGQSFNDTFTWLMRMAGRLILRFNDGEFLMGRRLAKHRLLNGIPDQQAEAISQQFAGESTSLVLEPLRWSGQLACPRTYIRSLRDLGPLTPALQSKMAARLGREARIIDVDACHYAALEKPEEIARLLNEIARQTAAAGF